ncbi:SRPBCC family protein [Promicromonospora iranensis]|uniref:SRPBCC family protein n=1 Tax=Promicromonospora iranensis TaxID=1105144 RepID=UPI0023A93737|nr:SRPBCC family protein [Promicromonospora iranensis]
MSTELTATGHKEERADGTYVVLTRTFRAPIEDVWAAITEPDRLARWIGRWIGDPAQGSVRFEMLFEGEDVESEEYEINVCDAPNRLELTSHMAYDEHTPATWHLKLDLAEADGVTTLTFAQSMDDPAMAENVGPGWEYYLDRLVAAETGGDPATVDFGDYYPALSGYYRTL